MEKKHLESAQHAKKDLNWKEGFVFSLTVSNPGKKNASDAMKGGDLLAIFALAEFALNSIQKMGNVFNATQDNDLSMGLVLVIIAYVEIKQ